jgi:hypothetical protein
MYYKQHSDITTECWLRNTHRLYKVHIHISSPEHNTILEIMNLNLSDKVTQLT